MKFINQKTSLRTVLLYRALKNKRSHMMDKYNYKDKQKRMLIDMHHYKRHLKSYIYICK